MMQAYEKDCKHEKTVRKPYNSSFSKYGEKM